MIRWHRVVTALLIGGALSCGEALPPAPPPATPLEVGESRSIELRYLRFDVANYEETLTREDLLALPEETRQRLWLLDLDLTNGPNSPRLLENALRAIKQLPASQLEPAAANMQGLLLMTPDTAALEGTALEELTALSPLVGIPSERVVAQMLGVGVTEPILSEPVVTATILDQVIATHPNALTRLGPRTPDNPEGVYPVAPGTLPITLEDVASDFATLSQKFGPVQTAQGSHPGFIVGATRAKVFEDDFSLTVRANANALPYKGVDLTDGSGASVNSLRAQIEELFDFDDPDWLQIEGLVIGEPVIEEMTFQIVEEETLVTGGTFASAAGTWRLTGLGVAAVDLRARGGGRGAARLWRA